MHRYLKLATKSAKKHEYDAAVDYKLCAVVVRGGAILSVGFNRSETNGFVEHYTNLVKGCNRDFLISTHAEMDAVLQARRRDIDLRGAKVYVSRIRPPGADGTVGMSRPCIICQRVLASYGIKRAYYTIDDNTYGVMNIVGQVMDDQLIAY